jgi:hypothetical protein
MLTVYLFLGAIGIVGIIAVLIYRLSHIKFHSVIGRRRITIQPPPSGLVKFNM